ncbi:MAG: dTDP-4-dehydrorhamnose reductase [Novosphingobium sp.]
MKAERRILVVGGMGQVGLELAQARPYAGYKLVRPRRDELDITQANSVSDYLASGEWAGVINCAAWTAVDLAEDNVAEAFLANCQGPAILGEAAKALGIPIIQLSTDYVFDGKLDRPYLETDPVNPLGVYGASKLAGELAVACANARSVILRTAWVVSAQRANFLKTMLRIGAGNQKLRVVADQRGCPTSAADLAVAALTIIRRLIEDPQAPAGTYNFVNAGDATWLALARHIFGQAALRGGPNPEVLPIATADYPTRAHRPANSRLDTTKLTADYGIQPRDWRIAVDEILEELLPTNQHGSIIN